MRRDVSEAEAIPRGYGMAYYEWHTDYSVCYPLGINVIVHYARRVYHWMMVRKDPSSFDRAYRAGRSDERKEWLDRRQIENREVDAMIRRVVGDVADRIVRGA